jgi:glycosyltransferase involved in cell wall biosynthesis
MKHVYVNGRWLTQPTTGTQRYAEEIFLALTHLNGFILTLCVPAIASVPAWIRDSPAVHVRHLNASGFWFDQCALPWVSRGEVLLTMSGPGSFLKRRQLTVIHDVGFLRFPTNFRRLFRIFYSLALLRSVLFDRWVVTVSEFSRHEIMRILGRLANRVVVVPGAGDHVLRVTPQRPSVRLPERYVLIVGSLTRRKNVLPILRAIEAAGIDVVVAGALGNDKVFDFSSRDLPSGPNITYLGRASDDELKWLYQHCSVFVVPSLYEGFGLPGVEALNCGARVLASSIPAFVETLGANATFFDPENPEEFIDRLESLLKESTTSVNFSGLSTWSTSAARLICIFRG